MGGFFKKNVKSQNPQPQRRLRDLLFSPTHKYLDERSLCAFCSFLTDLFMAFKPNLLHGCFCSLCFNSCARQNRKLHRLRILTLLYHTRIIKTFRHLLETQLYEVDSKGIFHWEALDLSRWIPPPLENILNFAPTIYNPLGRSLFGTGEPLMGLKPWPCLKQKYPKIHTLFRKTPSIFFYPQGV